MSENSNLPARLRAERVRLGLTQAGLAEALGVPTPTLRSYETGRSEPPASILSRLMRAGVDAHFVVLGMPATEFLEEHIDWQLFAEIAQLIGEWSASRPRPLGFEEQGRYLRMAYGWASKNGKDFAVTMLHELRNAA